MIDLISALNDFSAGWLPAIGRASLQGGIFVAAVWVLCRVFRGLPASLRYWIWWIACAQWIVRLVLVSPIELPVLPAETAAVAPVAEASAPVSFSAQPFVPVSVPTTSYVAPVRVAPAVALTPASFAMLVWALGILSLGVFSVRKLAYTRRIVLGAQPIPAGTDCPEIAIELSKEMGIRTPILRESEAIRCPMLAGWFRPTILLPSGFAEGEPKQIVRLALAHEMAHIRRHDLWFGAAPALGQLVLFFHPLAWLAVHEAAAAREESCDIEALHVAGGTPATYARLLLDTAQANSLGAALGAAFGYRLLHRRIKMLNQSLRLDSRRTRRAASLLVLASALCAIPWTVTGQTTKPAKPTKNSTTKPAATSVKKSTKKTAAKTVVVKGTAVRAIATTLPNGGKTAVAGRTIAVTGTAVGQAFGGTAVAGQPFSGTTVTGSAFSGTAVAGQAFGGTAYAGRVAGTTVKGTLKGKTVKATGIAGRSLGISTSGAAPSENASTRSEATSPVATGSAQSDVGPVAQAGGFGGGGFGGANGAQSTGGGFGGGGFGQGEFQRMETMKGDGNLDDHSVTVRFKNIDVRTAITEMFHAANVNFVIRSGVGTPDDLVTCELTNRPLSQALEALLKGARQELTYRVEGNVYYITVKP